MKLAHGLSQGRSCLKQPAGPLGMVFQDAPAVALHRRGQDPGGLRTGLDFGASGTDPRLQQIKRVALDARRARLKPWIKEVEHACHLEHGFNGGRTFARRRSSIGSYPPASGSGEKDELSVFCFMA
ncbi:hypothetical protein [Paracoccus sp. 22332]|uniref:hypothetical protein n=1 Tax=Paracoccus sp. 22332 TaxID=3453913 RepID=UPI003F87D762